MGQKQSKKEELLYHQVTQGNLEAIKSLHQQGARLEWLDGQGKTPLIVACLKPELYDVAKTLIQLGAHVNAYRPGHHAGTPLHHAAASGLDQTVKLLLSNGANALMTNDNRQTPRDVARIKGYNTIVRTIESHICFFSGWLREIHGPGFLELIAPQWFSSKNVWVVLIPRRSRNPKKPIKLELAIYLSLQDARPRTTVALRKAKIKEPKFCQPDPVLTIVDKHARKRYKLASAKEGDKQQLRSFWNACKGICQEKPPPSLLITHAAVVPVAEPPISEDVELAMAINASILSAMEELPPVHDTHLNFGVSNTTGLGSSPTDFSQDGGIQIRRSGTPSKMETSGWLGEPTEDSVNGWGLSEAVPSSSSAQNGIPVVSINHEVIDMASIPSAPPVPEGVESASIHYPLIDSSPVDLPMWTTENKEPSTDEVKKDVDSSSSCVICLDAPLEGACIPCGHMAGCMSCLNGIKVKKCGCPVCRANIVQVIRIYAV